MFILILFIGVLILLIINSSASKLTNKRCLKQHKWVIRFENNDKKGYLICKECGMIPGEE